MPNKIIIADASVLIALSNINQLEILKKVYNSIIITPEVKMEFGEKLPRWIHVEEVKDKQKIKILELKLDNGEASSLALALEQGNSLLIIDERKGREVAKKMGIKIIGLLGIIVKAKELEIIELVKPIFDKLEHVEFRISEELKKKILLKAGEN